MSTTVGTGANLLSDERVAALRAAFRGELIASDHTAYDHARRVWNGNMTTASLGHDWPHIAPTNARGPALKS